MNKSNYSEIKKWEEWELIEFLSSKVDINKANKYVEKLTVGYFDNNEFKKFNVTDHIDNFQKYGHGTFFYFYFLKFWTIIFLIMSFISLVPIFFNYFGNGLKSKSESNYLLSTTLGNSKVSDNINDLYNTGIPLIDNLTENNISLIYEICDVLYSLVFFISIIIFNIKVRNIKQKINKKINSPNNITLQLSGFKHEIISKDDIYNFFLNLGFELKEVNFAYSFNNSMETLIKIANLNKNMLIKKKQLENLKLESKIKNNINEDIKEFENKININFKKINKIFKSVKDIKLDKLKVIKIFVTFKDIESKKKALKEFNKEYYKLFFCCRKKEEKYYFKNQKFSFKTPDYPENIIWENIEYNFINQMIRVFFVLLIFLIIFFLSFLALYALSIFDNTSSEGINNCGTRKILISDITWNTTNRILNCFCEQQNYLDLVQIPRINKVCKNYLNSLINNYIISISSGLVIAFINIILNFFALKLIDFTKSHSLSSIVKQKIIYGVIVNFLSSFLIFFLLYQNFGNFKIVNIFNSFLSKYTNYGEYQIKQEFREIRRNWYFFVGVKIISTLVVSIIMPFVDIWLYLLNKFFNYLKNKKSVCMEDYIEKIKPNQFEIDAFFSTSISILIIGLICSGGMPITIIVVFFYFLISFWVNKFIFRYWTFKPPLYTSNVIDLVIAVLPYILLFHLLFSIFCYGSGNIFVNNSVTQTINNSINNIINLGNSTFILKAQKFILLSILALITIAYIIIDILLNIFKSILFSNNKIINYKISEKNIEIKSKEIKLLQSYNIWKNYNYKKLLYLENKTKTKILNT